MPGFSDYTAGNVLAYLTGKTAMPTLPTAYVALFTVAPTSDAGTGGTEVTGGAYARVSTTGPNWNVPSASSGTEPATTPASTSNSATISFPTATANWGTVVAFGLYDAATSGNLLAFDFLGNYSWLPASISAASPGVVMAAALPIMLGAQLLMQAMNFDVLNVPARPIHPYLRTIARMEGEEDHV